MLLATLSIQACSSRHAATESLAGKSIDPVAAPTRLETVALLRADKFAELDARFAAIQTAYEKNILSDEQLRNAFRAFYDTDAALRPKYDLWVANFPKSYVARLARAIYYRRIGQVQRGGGTISQTSDSRLRGMEAAFGLSMRDLQASTSLDKRPLLTVFNELAIAIHDGNAQESRALLDESLRIDPGNVIIRHDYMISLEPRWGGSTEQMTAFLDESRKAGLPEPKLRYLEAVIVSDQADALKDAGDFPAAEREYRKAIAMGGEDCLACFGGVLLEQRKYAETIPVFTRVLDEEPANDDVLARRATAFIATGDMRAGLADLKAAAALGNVFAENNLGIYYMMGVDGLPRDPEQGLAWFHKCAAQGSAPCIENVKRALPPDVAPGAQPPSRAAREPRP